MSPDVAWLQRYLPPIQLSPAQLEEARSAASAERLDGYFIKGWHYPVGTEHAFYFVMHLLERLEVAATPEEVRALVAAVGYDFDADKAVRAPLRDLAYLCLARDVERFAPQAAPPVHADATRPRMS